MKKLLSAVLCIALLIGIVPLCGLFSIPVTAADDDYTDPAHPYVATSFSGLREVFNKHRPDGKKIYIKLGNDIYYESTDFSFTLHTDGADVDLDLCGYTLSVNDRVGYSGSEPHALIYGQTGTVTVRDSAVDYSENDEEIKGKIVYEFEYGDEIRVNTMIFTGDIVIESGYFQNKTKGKGMFYE